MAELYLYQNKIDSVFQLLGEKENNISFSVGWALANCSEFMRQFLKHICVASNVDPAKIEIRLQQYEEAKGFTDFEIYQENELHIVIEAKRGWTFPTLDQLKKYEARKTFRNSKARDKRILIFNESTPAFVSTNFKTKRINTIPVEVMSWHQLQRIVGQSNKASRGSENRFLRELHKYLKGISTMQSIDSNWVYVVSLGNDTPPKWKISWRDIVSKKMKYFHPVGGGKGGWPQEPTNYIAFRYDGVLQSIHHIDRYEVFTNPREHFKEAPADIWEECYLYHLGPAIKPDHVVKSGRKIVRSMRVWAMLDLLLTCRTIQEARDESRKREEVYLDHR